MHLLLLFLILLALPGGARVLSGCASVIVFFALIGAAIFAIAGLAQP